MPIIRSRQQVFKTSPIDNEDGLVGWWTFDGAARDISGRQNNPTAFQNAPLLMPFPAIAPGMGASGMRFVAASTQNFSLPTATNSQVFTYIAWIYLSTISIYQAIIQSDTAGGITFRLNDDNTLHLLREGQADLGGSTGTIAVARPTHVAASFTTGNGVFYINGLPSGTTASAGSFNNGVLKIGGAGSTHFNGLMYYVKMFHRILTPSDIYADYAGSINSPSLSPDEWEMPIMSSGAAGFKYWAVDNNVGVIGTGTY